MANRPVDDAVIQVTEVTGAGESRPARPRRTPSKAGYDYEDPSRKRIPAAAWRTKDYNATARRVQAKVAKLHEVGPGRPRGGCYLSEEVLAAQLGLSERTVTTSTSALVKGGGMTRETRSTGEGQQTSIRWTVWPAANQGDWWLDVPVGAIDQLRGYEYPVLCELILRHTTNQDTSPRAIARALGLSRTQLSVYMARLSARDLVVIEKRGGRQGADVYWAARWSVDDAWFAQVTFGPKLEENAGETPTEDPEKVPETTGGNCAPAATRSCAPAAPETCAPSKERFEGDVMEADRGLRSAVGAAERNARENAASGGTHEVTAENNEADAAVGPRPTSGLRPERKSKSAATVPSARPRPKQPYRRRPDRELLVAVRRDVLAQAGEDLLCRLSTWQRQELEARLALALEDEPDLSLTRMFYRLRNALQRVAGHEDKIEDLYPWLFKATTHREGCSDPNCEDGLLWWHSEQGLDAGCSACKARAEVRAASKRGLTLLPGPADPPRFTAADAVRSEVPTADEFAAEWKRNRELMRANAAALAERDGRKTWKRTSKWKPEP